MTWEPHYFAESRDHAIANSAAYFFAVGSYVWNPDIESETAGRLLRAWEKATAIQFLNGCASSDDSYGYEFEWEMDPDIHHCPGRAACSLTFTGPDGGQVQYISGIAVRIDEVDVEAHPECQDVEAELAIAEMEEQLALIRPCLRSVSVQDVSSAESFLRMLSDNGLDCVLDSDAFTVVRIGDGHRTFNNAEALRLNQWVAAVWEYVPDPYASVRKYREARRKMTPEQLETLAAELEEQYPDVSGWLFSYEYPGFFQYVRRHLVLCCTPDWNDPGFICLQLMDAQGEHLDSASEDLKYTPPLTAEQYVDLMRPVLTKFAEANENGHLFSVCNGRHSLVDGSPISHDCKVVPVLVLRIDRDWGPTRGRNLWRLVDNSLTFEHVHAMTREEMIDLCCDNDPNGCYTDESQMAEYGHTLSDQELREIIFNEIADYGGETIH